MAPLLFFRLREYRLWPSRGRLLLLLVLLHHLPNAFSQFEGYSNVHFETQPQDLYTTPSLNIAIIKCKAKGTLISSGQEELLDVRFLHNNISLNSKFFPASRHQYQIEGDNDFVVGVVIEPIQLSDNGGLYKCQARINDSAINLFSDTALLTVGDGRPPSIPLTLSSVGLYHIDVTWSSLVLPSNGLITQYKAKVYDKLSNELIYTRTASENVYEYTFNDLSPNTIYKLSIIGINNYGEGDEEAVLLQATTQTPIVTDQPSDFSVVTNPGPGNIIVSVEPPLFINTDTMTPIENYTLQYYITSIPSNSQSRTMSADMPHFFLYDLTVGESYTFKLFALNSAGHSDPLVVEYTVVPYTGTVTLVTPTTSFATSTTTTSSNIIQITTTTTNIPNSTSQSSSTNIQSNNESTIVLITSSTTVPSLLTTRTTSLITSSSITSNTSTSTSSSSNSITLSNTVTTQDMASSSTATPNTTSTSSTATASTSISSSVSTNIVPSSSSTVSTQSIVRSTSVTLRPSTQSTLNTRPSSTVPSTADQSNTNNNDLPVNVVVIGIGLIALVILIAIIVVAILLVVFCIRSRKETADFTDFEPPSWPHNKPPSGLKKTWGSKDSSIKGSPLGSINHSISDDIELPIDGLYLQVPSESPPSIRGDRDDKSDSKHHHNNGVPKVSPV